MYPCSDSDYHALPWYVNKIVHFLNSMASLMPRAAAISTILSVDKDFFCRNNRIVCLVVHPSCLDISTRDMFCILISSLIRFRKHTVNSSASFLFLAGSITNLQFEKHNKYCKKFFLLLFQIELHARTQDQIRTGNT